MSEKMSKAPVYLVLAQVQFNSVLALDKYISSIQESFRKLGYPDFRTNLMQTFNLNVGPQSQVVPVAPLAQYVFSDIEKTRAFVLLHNSLTYNVTEYDVFGTFSAELLNGLEVIQSAVGGLSYTERIGVRYLDAIFPTASETLSLYLTPSVMGLVEKIGGTLTHSFFETATRLDQVNVVSRVIVQPGSVGLPADLQPFPVEIPDRFKTLNGLHASLDNDGSTQVRAKFDSARLKKELLSIHDEINKVFKSTVTPYALERWR
jgi:uncharacterized protein (TIGR04255 family)